MQENSEKYRFHLKQIEDLVEQDSVSALNESHFKTLLFILKNEHEEFRVRAFKILANSHNERFLEPLIDEFTGSSWQFQHRKADYLVNFGPAVIKPLMLNYESMPYYVKLAAINAIGNFRDPDTLYFLCSLVKLEFGKSDKQTLAGQQISRKAIKAIGKIRHRDSIGTLTDAVKHPCFHQIAMFGLRMIGKYNPEWLIPYLKHENLFVRKKIVQMLGDFRCRNAVETLADGLRSAEYSMKLRIITALGKIGGDNVLPYLYDLLTHENANIRENTVKALGDIGNHDSFGKIIGMRDDPNPADRSKVVRTLGQLGNPDAIPYLVDLSTDIHRNVRRNAALALAHFSDAESQKALIGLLDDLDNNVVTTAIESISKLKQPGIIDTLSLLLEDKRNSVRKSAIRAIGEQGDHSAFGLLVGSLSETDPQIRMETLIALGRIDDIRAVQHVAYYLDSLDPLVRLAAKWSFNRLKYHRTVDARHIFKQLNNPLVRDIEAFTNEEKIHPIMIELVLDVFYYRKIDKCDVPYQEFYAQLHDRINSLDWPERKKVILNLRSLHKYKSVYGIDATLWGNLMAKYPDRVRAALGWLSCLGVLIFVLWLLYMIGKAIWTFLVFIWDWLLGLF